MPSSPSGTSAHRIWLRPMTPSEAFLRTILCRIEPLLRRHHCHQPYKHHTPPLHRHGLYHSPTLPFRYHDHHQHSFVLPSKQNWRKKYWKPSSRFAPLVQPPLPFHSRRYPRIRRRRRWARRSRHSQLLGARETSKGTQRRISKTTTSASMVVCHAQPRSRENDTHWHVQWREWKEPSQICHSLWNTEYPLSCNWLLCVLRFFSRLGSRVLQFYPFWKGKKGDRWRVRKCRSRNQRYFRI